MAYLIAGFNAEKASKMCGVPARTIREWTEADWWADVMAKAKLEKQSELDAAMTEIIHKGTSGVLERLEKGDPFVAKDGTVQFKPMTGKDQTMVVAIMSDKRALIRGEPTRRTENISEKDRLKALRESLSNPQKAAEDGEKTAPAGMTELH